MKNMRSWRLRDSGIRELKNAASFLARKNQNAKWIAKIAVTSLKSVISSLWLSAKPRVYWTIWRGRRFGCVDSIGLSKRISDDRFALPKGPQTSGRESHEVADNIV
jgi:hypothetical protein